MLCDFVLALYKLLVKTKKIVLKKEILLSSLKHFIYKGKSGASKMKRSTENLTSMICESFILELYFLELFVFVLALYSYCGDKK